MNYYYTKIENTEEKKSLNDNQEELQSQYIAQNNTKRESK